MPPIKQHITDIPTEAAHDGTTMRKKLIVTDDNKGKLATYNYAWLEKGKQLTTHKHVDGEEYYFFLEGEGEMLLGKEWFPVRTGDYITVLHDTDHSVKNTGEENLVFMAIRTVDA
jgi:mannose-6-phosphate isomerase-like protein (cupin superfamily)